MDWVNHYAPAIQAIAAAGTLLLTLVLAYATWKYVHLAECQLQVIREQSARQQPAFIFEIYASVWQIYAHCRNVGASNGLVNSIVLNLSVQDTGAVLLDKRWHLNEFLQPGKSLRRTLHDGMDGKGLVELPRRGLWDAIFNRPGPSQPCGLLTAEAHLACGGEAVVLRRTYEVYASGWGAKLKRLEAETPHS